MGSVFSPYYAWSGRARPENHCAINIALYGPLRRWAMTERSGKTLRRSASAFRLGASPLQWDGEELTVDIQETCMPVPRPIVGRLRLVPISINERAYCLSREGDHLWRPFAPLARVQVDFEQPKLSWRGHAYFDSNFGAEPLENGFRSWTWSRSCTDGDVRVFYDAECRRGGSTNLGLAFRPDGEIETIDAPPFVELDRTTWRMPRRLRSEGAAGILQTLEDAPFYCRNRLVHQLDGKQREAVHESLDLDRFSSPIVKLMLPFRMPRRG